MFSHIANQLPKRTMVLAHTEELVDQAAAKLCAVTGKSAEVEMNIRRADVGDYWMSKFVVSSVQTQNAGRNGKGRMSRFDPNDFSLLVIDEAHRSLAKSYRRCIDYYCQNEDLKVLGVTATPKRGDEQAMGQVYDHVAWNYDILFGIKQGWLVPIVQSSVRVDSIDLSGVKTTAGDLNAGDLARVMQVEKTLHGVANPIVEHAAGRRTLVFAASVQQAQRIAEIIRRRHETTAAFVSGKTPKEDRRGILRDYKSGRIQFLVNVGVFTEGFDDPGIEMVAIARPTKSQALYAQMVGRGTRPLGGVVDGLEEAEQRVAAIAGSDKRRIEILDFEGNAGRHKLVTAADILGGKVSEAVKEKVRRRARDSSEPVDVLWALENEKLELALKREADERAEAKRRQAVIAKVQYSTQEIDPFDVYDIRPTTQTTSNWGRDLGPTDRQVACLQRFRIPIPPGLTRAQATQLIGRAIDGRQNGEASYNQQRLLMRFGVDPKGMTFEQARDAIDAIRVNGWKATNRTTAGTSP